MSKLSAAVEKFTEKASAGSEEKEWLVFLIHRSFFVDGNGATIFTMPDRLDTKFKFTFSEFDSAAAFQDKLKLCLDKFKPSGLIVFPPPTVTIGGTDLSARLENTLETTTDCSVKKLCVLLPTSDKTTAVKLTHLRYKFDNLMLADQNFLCTTSGEPSTFKLITSCIRALENALKLSARHQEGFTIVENKERSYGHSTPRGRGQKRRGNYNNHGNHYNNNFGYYNKRGRGGY